MVESQGDPSNEFSYPVRGEGPSGRMLRFIVIGKIQVLITAYLSVSIFG
jgi:hypothetical protein